MILESLGKIASLTYFKATYGLFKIGAILVRGEHAGYRLHI